MVGGRARVIGPSLLARAEVLREVEVIAQREDLVELEIPVRVVDLVVGELVVLAGAVRVETAGVPRVRRAAPLEADGVPLVHVEREPEPERGRYRSAAR